MTGHDSKQRAPAVKKEAAPNQEQVDEPSEQIFDLKKNLQGDRIKPATVIQMSRVIGNQATIRMLRNNEQAKPAADISPAALTKPMLQPKGMPIQHSTTSNVVQRQYEGSQASTFVQNLEAMDVGQEAEAFAGQGALHR